MKQSIIGFLLLTFLILFLNSPATEAAGKIKVKPAEVTEIECKLTAKNLYKTVLGVLKNLEYKIDSKKKRKYVRAVKNDVKVYSIIAAKDGSSSVVGDGILYQTSVSIWLEELQEGTTMISVYSELEEFKLKYPNNPISVKKERKLDKEKEVATKLEEIINKPK